MFFGLPVVPLVWQYITGRSAVSAGVFLRFLFLDVGSQVFPVLYGNSLHELVAGFNRVEIMFFAEPRVLVFAEDLPQQFILYGPGHLCLLDEGF